MGAVQQGETTKSLHRLARLRNIEAIRSLNEIGLGGKEHTKIRKCVHEAIQHYNRNENRIMYERLTQVGTLKEQLRWAHDKAQVERDKLERRLVKLLGVKASDFVHHPYKSALEHQKTMKEGT